MCKMDQTDKLQNIFNNLTIGKRYKVPIICNYIFSNNCNIVISKTTNIEEI